VDLQVTHFLHQLLLFFFPHELAGELAFPRQCCDDEAHDQTQNEGIGKHVFEKFRHSN
jgi:hypothetical protein